jgi:DNA repair exonuclease SbcCD ATPase subunit
MDELHRREAELRRERDALEQRATMLEHSTRQRELAASTFGGVKEAEEELERRRKDLEAAIEQERDALNREKARCEKERLALVAEREFQRRRGGDDREPDELRDELRETRGRLEAALARLEELGDGEIAAKMAEATVASTTGQQSPMTNEAKLKKAVKHLRVKLA